MADGILGLGSSSSGVSLDQSLIDQLKEADSASQLDPITAEIEDTEAEIEAVDAVESKILELLAVMENLDLYTSGTNVFDEVSANTSGDSVVFDAADTSSLNPGTINVTVEQLSTKDVYQSDTISNSEDIMDDGTLSITVGDETYDFVTTGLTYEEVLTEMNYYSSLDVALEQVSDDTHRFVIKSTESGLSNAITISQSGDLNLGFENEDNHVLTAQNFKGTVDGIDYDLSSNKFTMNNGLIISAIETGDSSISIEQDSSYVVDAVESMATIYNELVDLVNSYVIGDEDDPALISDSSTLRTIMTDIKNYFYESYGLTDEENAFVYGLSFDIDGYMELDSTTLTESLTSNLDDVKELFVGYAEKEGIGTALKTYLDALDSTDGTITSYQERLDEYLETLNDDYDSASESLDEKYQTMASQFADYTVLINQMENDFASLQAIIDSED
ncbi:flagellar filament capping protein FliD [Arcobacter sp. LA11]|uniref:flagellar filament capping protein FliD n=1 Tax=Arcobacter sp. LA11 TaxID=1898176 RepID=UPI000934F72B|nr:flagellar filament capping protein FliD [Arcobacter sp. LA11]